MLLLAVSPTLAQQYDRKLYFQRPDGSIGVMDPQGGAYVITPFPTNPRPSYPPPDYGTPPASPYLGQPSPSYQHECQGGGPAGCVYGYTGQ
jgi:hypothetical protein